LAKKLRGLKRVQLLVSEAVQRDAQKVQFELHLLIAKAAKGLQADVLHQRLQAASERRFEGAIRWTDLQKELQDRRDNRRLLGRHGCEQATPPTEEKTV
jgi:hypothetical protein